MRATCHQSLVLAIFLVLLASPTQTAADARVAMVIGVDRYTHLPDLANATHDARAIAEQLEVLGFEVLLHENVDKRQIFRALADFETRLTSGGGTGLVFFAGHGIQADGRNYLVPSDANLEYEADLESEAIDARRILETMARSGNPLNILVLDACRDNPLPQRTRSASRGLTVTSIPPGANGTAILYAAGEGQVAEDGPPGGHGLFTEALLETLYQPNLTLEQVIKQVTRRVLERSNGRQRPWSLASVQGDFYFNPVNSSAVGEDMSIVAELWKEIRQSEDPSMIESFADRYPGTSYERAARLKLARLSITNAAREPAITTRQIGPHEMVGIQGGCYMMGSRKESPGHISDERLHRICVDDFMMDRFETTHDAYDEFTKATGRDLVDDEDMGRGRRPVVAVEFDEALAYARWASEKYGVRFRLPTEAEWEYACRSGGRDELFCGGNDPGRIAVFDADGTAPVGSKEPNGLGLHDMSGNAFEMTCSPYTTDGDTTSAGYDGEEKICQSYWMTTAPMHSVSNVFRGGQWDSEREDIRATVRHWYAEGGRFSGTRYVPRMGFRLVAEPPDAKTTVVDNLRKKLRDQTR